MGSSPIKQNPIQIFIIINKKLLQCDSEAPSPVFDIHAFRKDSEDNNIPIEVNIKDNSINYSKNAFSENIINKIESTFDKNLDNNIAQNIYDKELDNNSFNLFNSINLQGININNINNNNVLNNNDVNNFMKEGIKQETNFGKEQKDESNENKYETNQGNTNDDLKDINYGSGFAKEEKDKYKGYNYSENDFEISQIFGLSEEKTLEESQVLLDKGLFPLFIKLNESKLQFFYVDRHSTLKIMLKAYFDNTPGIDTNIFNNIKLYLGKRPLDINEEIQYLKLKQYSVIKDIETEEEEIVIQK